MTHVLDLSFLNKTDLFCGKLEVELLIVYVTFICSELFAICARDESGESKVRRCLAVFHFPKAGEEIPHTLTS